MTIQKEAIFGGKNAIPPDTLKALVIRGGNEVVKDFLKSQGWDEEEPVAMPIIIANNNGRIIGSNWELCGKVKDVAIKMDHLFPGKGSPNHIVTFDLDLSAFSVPEGVARNWTTWLEGSTLDPTIWSSTDGKTKDGAVLDDWENLGHGPFCLRLHVIPNTSTTALLYLGAIGESFDKLKTRPRYDASGSPHIGVSMSGSSSGRHYRKEVNMGVAEQTGEGYGIGVLPLVKQMYTLQSGPTAPEERNYREQTHAMLRDVRVGQVLAPTEILAALENEALYDYNKHPIKRWPTCPKRFLGQPTTGKITSLNPTQFNPTPAKINKYSNVGGFNSEIFEPLNIPDYVTKHLLEDANHCLAVGSWANMRTALRAIGKAETWAGFQFEFPFGIKEIMTYISYLRTVRRMQADSVDSYLCYVRYAHMKKGMCVPVLRPDIIKCILKGGKIKDSVQKKLEGKKPRLAVTMNWLLLIRALLKKSMFSQKKKKLIWSICTIAYWGSFRIHELLSRKTTNFDVQTTLLRENVTLSTAKHEGVDKEFLSIHLKHPKEEALAGGVTIEIFECKNKKVCPIASLKNWAKNPGFRHAHVQTYRGEMLHWKTF